MKFSRPSYEVPSPISKTSFKGQVTRLIVWLVCHALAHSGNLQSPDLLAKSISISAFIYGGSVSLVSDLKRYMTYDYSC
jgi:hypothetical protein